VILPLLLLDWLVFVLVLVLLGEFVLMGVWFDIF
jgi:hypothetical protein